MAGETDKVILGRVWPQFMVSEVMWSDLQKLQQDGKVLVEAGEAGEKEFDGFV